jgi:hypothetical protein
MTTTARFKLESKHKQTRKRNKALKDGNERKGIKM